MKSNVSVWLSGMIFTAMLATMSAAQSDSLADYARAIRKDKPATQTRTFDNDNLPTKEKLSVVGVVDAPKGTAPETASAAAPSPSSTQGALTPDQQQHLNDDWKGKFSDQKDKIDLLNRELTVAQKEYQLRAAAMYGDAGSRLRNATEWDKENAQDKDEIAAKQKALDEAKQQLADMQEDARKDGVPSSVREPEPDSH